MTEILIAAIPVVVKLVESIIRLAAGTGCSEQECEDAKTQILASLKQIDANLIAQEAREWNIARGIEP